MPIFQDAGLEEDVKSRMIAWMDSYIQLRKVVQRAHVDGTVFDGTDAELDAIRDIVQDFEAEFGDNGTGAGLTPTQRRTELETYGTFNILS